MFRLGYTDAEMVDGAVMDATVIDMRLKLSVMAHTFIKKTKT